MAEPVYPRRVEITRGDAGFGFNLSKAGGSHFLRKVDEGGAAWQGGARSGDRILAVNDVSVTHKNHKELVALIKASSNPMSMILLASEEMMQIPESAVSIQIVKGAGGFGFNLGRKGAKQFFKKVDEGGPTHLAGGATGDVIFEINGISITGLTHKDLVRLIKAGGSTVQMKIVKDIYQKTSMEAASAEKTLSAGDKAQQAASNTIAQARVRAEAAMKARREEEGKLAEARKKEQQLQYISEGIKDMRTRTDEVKKKLAEVTDRIAVQRTKTAAVATREELKELEDTLVLIEAEAINDLNTRQDELPVAEKGADEVEVATVQLAEMTWEYEVAVCREHLAQSRLSELAELLPQAQARRKQEKEAEKANLGELEERRKRDLAAIEDRKRRMDQQMADIKATKEKQIAEAKAAKEQVEARRRAELVQRAEHAKKMKEKMRQDSDAKSLAEQRRREQVAADEEYARLDEEKRQKRQEALRAEQRAKEEAEQQERLANPGAAFGGGSLRSQGSLQKAANQATGGDEDHPMLAMMFGSGSARSGTKELTNLCKPPDTHM